MATTFIRRQWGAISIGLTVTLLAAMLHGVGVTRRVEWMFLDGYLSHLNHVTASSNIVHVDIDDDSLARVGSWPWPRDLQADMVRVLGELGTRNIVLDVVFSEPRDPEIHLPKLSRSSDVSGLEEMLEELSPENIVFPDDELAAAIRDAGTIYNSMFYKPAAVPTPLERRVIDAYKKDVTLGPDALVASLGDSPELIRSLPLAGLRRKAVLNLVQETLAADRQADLKSVHRRVTTAQFERTTPVGEDVRWAYQVTRSLQAVEDRCPFVPSGLAGKLPSISDVTPPLFKFVAGARNTGFVVFEKDADGTLRHLPILLEWRGRLVKQLAFAVVCDELGIHNEDLSIDDRGFLVVAGRDSRPPMRVQMDEHRRLLLNWHRGGQSWTDSFTHVPVGKIIEVCDTRRQQRANEQRKQVRIARAMKLVKDDAAYAGYRSEVNRYLADRRRLHAAELDGRVHMPEFAALRSGVDQQRRHLDADYAATLDLVRQTWKDLQSENPDDSDVAVDYRRFQEAHAILVEECDEFDRVNAALDERAARTLAVLSPLLKDKTCFVGYTATALADMVDTPVFALMPGVMVHSNLMNTFEQRAFLRWTSPWQRSLLIILTGLVVTLVSARHGPRITGTFVLLMMLAIAAVHAAALKLPAHLWLGAISAIISCFVTWALVVMFRFLVSEREKRRFSKALAQYTSPAIARRIAQEAGDLDLSPVGRDVTCFFSDLAGFTTISEQYLDPAKTRTVLNPYLEAMSEALNRHAALINKFMGDGIFAFFNPPIYPVADHARAACEAAIDSQQSLEALIASRRDSPLASVFSRLSMRIGLASGPVYVGDYGSENKLDYTCMGDTVNLAARLESANKAFGTRIMISGPTRDLTGDRFTCRPLGSLQVKGKKIAVPVYELLGRRNEVASEQLILADRWGEAVALFQARLWGEALAACESILKTYPDDKAAQRYIAVIRAYMVSSPAEDWNGAIELTEK